jgi:tripartite-type tricarboxylate transporter receptor subunit TctC
MLQEREKTMLRTTIVRFSRLALVAALATPLACTVTARAQDYPNRVVKLVIPFAGGSASDVLTRIVAEGLSPRIGQRVLVENRAGAGGSLGSNEAAKAAPDGYTLLMGASGPLAANKTLMKSLPFDPVKDFAPIGLVASMPNVLVVNPAKIPVRTVKAFVDFVKAHPGEVNYSSVGNGTSQHLAGALFAHNLRLDMQHVPYRDAGQMVLDLVSGRVSSSFQLIPNVAGHLGDDKLRPIAIMSDVRSTVLPETPTMAEQGFPGVTSSAWFGLFAPAGTPAAVINKLSAETIKMIADPAIKAQIIRIGADPMSSSPDELGKLLATDIGKWRDLITATGISIN